MVTEAVTHPKVAALVYIAAFAPDEGESVNTLIADPPPGAPVEDSFDPSRKRGGAVMIKTGRPALAYG